MRNLLLAGAILSVLSAGCVSIGKFNVLKDRVLVLEKEKAALAQDLERVNARVENLNERVAEKTENLQKTGASFGADLDAIRDEQAKLTGRVEQLEFRVENLVRQTQVLIDTMDEKLGTSVAALPKDLPQEKGALYDLGEQRLRGGMVKVARAIFREYVKRYPEDDKADDAQLFVAETYRTEKKCDVAIREYQMVHDKWPKGDMVAKALWQISACLLEQGDCAKARGVLEYLVDFAKSAPEAAEARAKLDELKKLGKKCR
jgi:TolA-binding protein